MTISVNQPVTIGERTGTVAELQISNGGQPTVWVKWDSQSVPVPEQANRLEFLDNQTESLTQEINHDTPRNSQQSRPSIISDTREHSQKSVETNAGQIGGSRTSNDAPGSVPATPKTTGRIDEASPRVNAAPGTDGATNKPTTRNSGRQSPTIREGVKRSVIRTDSNRRNFRRSDQELGQRDQELGRNKQSLENRGQSFGRDKQSLENRGQSFGNRGQSLGRSNEELRRIQQRFRDLANQVRETPLIEVVEHLGLQPDRYDKKKYKSDGHIISINEQKFYDHLNMKGGYGAIDLVMHVQRSNFKDAVEWLNGSAITPSYQVNSVSKQPTQTQTTKPEVKKEPFTPPVPDESKWLAVKEYLVAKRGLPIYIVNELHYNGTVYADDKQNAVFIRKNEDDKLTGASLRGTYNDSKFKGLAKGTERDAGWFTFKNGQGEIDRIVLTESPIDTLSAAAVSQKPETTLFISTDGSGSIPSAYLQQQLEQGKQILVAYDNDQAGEIMAEKVLDKLPGAVRVKPTIGKDWNEQLINSQIQDIAQTVQQVLTKYGEDSLTNDSVSFEGNKFIFSSDGNSLNIYSKARDKVVFEINPAKNHVLYDLNLPEKQILERFKYHPSVVPQQQRGIDFSR
ncbi:MAG: toprim domain-containing protein [Xenococcaceae cyanobacterium MO_167.B27]|nr:toprim domain-containing protein [Xenococcaceae cyanobacterium MO_167.B27]